LNFVANPSGDPIQESLIQVVASHLQCCVKWSVWNWITDLAQTRHSS